MTTKVFNKIRKSILNISFNLVSFNLVSLYFILILTLPALMQTFAFGSTSYGVLATSLIIIITTFHRHRYSSAPPGTLNSIIFTTMLSTFILFHGFVAIFGTGVESSLNRLLISIGILFSLVVAAFIISVLLKEIDSKIFEKVTRTLTILMIILVPVLIIRMNYRFFFPSEIQFLIDSIVVYSEPSHYVIAFMPIYLYNYVVGSYRLRILMTVIGISFVYTMGSWTFTVFFIGLFVIFILSRPKLLKMIMILITISLIVLWIGYTSDFYYIQKGGLLYQIGQSIGLLNSIGIGDTPSLPGYSLSTLSFALDWHQALLNLEKTNWLGVGFQQTGLSDYRSYIKEIIFIQSGARSWNIKLETFSLMPKLFSEFGTFAIIILVLYLKYFWVSIIKIKDSFVMKVIDIDKKMLLMNCFIVCNAVNLFIRGTGYFTTSTFFFVVACFYLTSVKKRER